MKTTFLAVVLFGVLVLGARDLQAQAYYTPYWDLQYQQYLQYQNYLHWQRYLYYLQQVDPYYDLHVMHYQLYLAPYQPFQIYPPCCYGFGIPTWSTPIGPTWSMSGRVPQQKARSRAPQAGRRR
jgi:hypothetical protein